MSNLRRDEVVTLAATALLTGLLIFTAGREQEEDERPPGSDSDSLAAFRARVPADSHNRDPAFAHRHPPGLAYTKSLRSYPLAERDSLIAPGAQVSWKSSVLSNVA